MTRLLDVNFLVRSNSTVVIMMYNYLDDLITRIKLFGLFDFDCSYNDILPWWLDYSE
jgi:hypothetical protein